MKRSLLKYGILVIFIGFFSGLNAQKNTKLNKWLTPADSLNKKRLGIVVGTGSAFYGLAVYGLYQYWYKDIPTSNFHFFNDNAEWLQMDKGGHLFTTFYESRYAADFYKWSGVPYKKAYAYGALTGTLFQLTVEMFDGYSKKWGFSGGDFAANSLGAGIALAQGLAWNEMRILVKFSSHGINYADDLEDRAELLYGLSKSEKVLKDYNGLTYWLSLNPYSFLRKESKFPKWLNFAVGYGAEGLYGGFENRWCEDGDVFDIKDCPIEEIIDRTDIPRYRQYYLSLDLDLTRIQTKSRVLKTLFGLISVIKIPAPTLEFRSDGKVKFHPLYF